MLVALLPYQTDCAFPDFRRKFAWFLGHGSILSRVGASIKSGAIHFSSAVTAVLDWNKECKNARPRLGELGQLRITGPL